MKQIIQQEPLVQKAVTIENVFSSSEEERYNYDLRERSKLDFASAMSCKLREGIEKGIVKGLKEGKKKEKYKIAKYLLSMNMNFEDIAKVTGLTIEEIKKL